VVAVTFADRVPGASLPINRTASVELTFTVGPAFQNRLSRHRRSARFFEASTARSSPDAFHGGDFSPAARTVIVNEAFVRGFVQRGIASPLGPPAVFQQIRRSQPRSRRSKSSACSGNLGLDSRCEQGATRPRMYFTPHRPPRCSARH
jgi:hypothetical protein